MLRAEVYMSTLGVLTDSLTDSLTHSSACSKKLCNGGMDSGLVSLQPILFYLLKSSIPVFLVPKMYIFWENAKKEFFS